MKITFKNYNPITDTEEKYPCIKTNEAGNDVLLVVGKHHMWYTGDNQTFYKGVLLSGQFKGKYSDGWDMSVFNRPYTGKVILEND